VLNFSGRIEKAGRAEKAGRIGVRAGRAIVGGVGVQKRDFYLWVKK